jgi:hypothetical protein
MRVAPARGARNPEPQDRNPDERTARQNDLPAQMGSPARAKFQPVADLTRKEDFIGYSG